MDMDQAPSISHLPIDLRFSAMSSNRGIVPAELSRKVPVELCPCTVHVRLYRDIVNAQLSLRKCVAHKMSIDIFFYLREAMLVPKRVNEGDFG